MATTYGTGTALQFSDDTQRQVLELGNEIHYYNPDVTPIFSIFGMKSAVTPVPIFEWMEDDYMIKRNIKQSIITSTAGDISGTHVGDTTTGGINGHNTIVMFDRQAQIEMFEVGGIYSATVAGGSAALQTGVTHFICVALGVNVNSANANHRMVQFLGAHVKSGDATQYQIEQCADGSDLITTDAAGVLTLEHIGSAGQYYDTSASALVAQYGYQGLWQVETLFVDDDEYGLDGGPGVYAEGAAVGVETRKKVRRLKNCTQIFREPYTITGTANAAKHYGGNELSRLQARKLTQIKTDCEYAIMTNGNYSLDATSENPKRTMAGFGVGGTAGTGFVQTNDGRGNANLQLTYAAGGTIDSMDAVCEYIFHDMVSGSMRKTVFASNKWMRKLASMARGGANTTGFGATAFYDLGDPSQSLGIRVRRFVGAVGELDFIPHPLLNGGLEDYALCIDPGNFSVRPLSSRDMQLRPDIVKDGRDGRTDEWLMEFGVEARNEQTHAILKLV